MIGWQKKCLTLAACLAVGMTGVMVGLPAGAEEIAAKPAVKIGLVASLFREVPKPMIKIATQPFGNLMHTLTGLKGDLVTSDSALALGKDLDDNSVQLGVFHGFEFAWARQKYPQLKPLMIAVNDVRHLKAVIVVRADSDINGFTDLKGKSIALPRRSREHCRLFLESRCKCSGAEPKQFFESICVPADMEVAIDDVIDKNCQAAIVDASAYTCFKTSKPGRAKRTKCLMESELFPAGVVAYHPDHVDKKTIERFKKGMLQAHTVATGRQLMILWRLTGFESIPEDYDVLLDNIAKAYPAPEPAAEVVEEK